MEVKDIKLIQFDRKIKKLVDYDKDIDEGVFLRYVSHIDISTIKLSFDIIEDKKDLYLLQDINTSILNDLNDAPEEIISLLQNEAEKSWDHVKAAYNQASEEDHINYLKALDDAGVSIYNSLKLFWENLPEETREDIKEKNKVKVIEEEINLNDLKNE